MSVVNVVSNRRSTRGSVPIPDIGCEVVDYRNIDVNVIKMIRRNPGKLFTFNIRIRGIYNINHVLGLVCVRFSDNKDTIVMYDSNKNPNVFNNEEQIAQMGEYPLAIIHIKEMAERSGANFIHISEVSYLEKDRKEICDFLEATLPPAKVKTGYCLDYMQEVARRYFMSYVGGNAVFKHQHLANIR